VKAGLLPYTVVAPGQGSTAYVAANGDHSILTVDVNARRIVGTQKVGRNPWSVATNPAGTKLLVANNRSANLSLLPTTNTLPGFSTPRSIVAGYVISGGNRTARAAKNVALSIDGKTGVFTDLANNQVVVVDTDTGQLVRAINVGKAPYGIELLRQ
jgi:YVTN family beta-propeller protein